MLAVWHRKRTQSLVWDMHRMLTKQDHAGSSIITNLPEDRMKLPGTRLASSCEVYYTEHGGKGRIRRKFDCLRRGQI